MGVRRFLVASFPVVVFACSSTEATPAPSDGPADSGVVAETAGDTSKDTKVDSTLETSPDGATDADETLTDTGEFDTRFAELSPWPDADVDAWMTGPTDAAGSCDGIPAPADAAPGTRFCELYRDLFAHSGVAKCVTYGCHGGDKGQSDLAMGWTPKSMYDKITTFATWIEPKLLVKVVPGGDSRPGSALHHALNADTGYFMPFTVKELGNRKLLAAETARVEAWLARGAPFD